MMTNLEADFASNNIIFFGCSLVDELDLLYATTLKLNTRKAQNKDTHIYYVRYCTETTPVLDRLKQKKLEEFSVTDIIEVSADQILTFYSFIRDISDRATKFNAADDLSPMAGFTFTQYDPYDRDRNIQYLFFPKTFYRTPKITHSASLLFVHRHITDEIIEDITTNHGYLHILRGSRMSGKTYTMIDILHQLQSKKSIFSTVIQYLLMMLYGESSV